VWITLDHRLVNNDRTLSLRQRPFAARTGASACATFAVREMHSHPNVQKTLVHSVENTGDTDVQFIGVFMALRYEEISLSIRLTHTPPTFVAQQLDVEEAITAEWPENTPGIMPKT